MIISISIGRVTTSRVILGRRGGMRRMRRMRANTNRRSGGRSGARARARERTRGRRHVENQKL